MIRARLTKGAAAGLLALSVALFLAVTGVWSERDVAFDAAALKAGTNVLKLTVPAGSTTNGVIYDYLRMELDEKSK
jgi:Polysaccharide lyase family 4, domain III